MAYDPTSTDPTQNIFAYGGNILDAQGNAVQSVAPTINSGNLQPTNQINYSSPNPSPIPSIEGLNTDYSTPALQATATERQANDLSSRLQGLNNGMVGKSQYQLQQNEATGVNKYTDQQNDLSTQLNQLITESKQIPLQLQNEANGRGITAGGLQPLQTASLRNNSIRALGVSSMLDATKGLLASAQAKADRAVSAKYDPIQEQITAATNNLALILNSPEYSLEQKNRAQAQLDVQNQKQKQLDKNKTDASTIQSWAAAAIANGATPTQAQEIMKIGQSDKPDLNAAFALYAPFAKDPVATQKALNELELQRANITKTRAEAAKAIADGNGTSHDSQTTATITGDVKDILEGRNTMFNIRQTMGRTNAAAAYMQKVRSEIRAVDPSFDFVASDAGGKSVSTAYVQRSTAAINSVLPNIDKIIDLSNQVDRIGIKGVDSLIQKGSLQINNQKVSNFHEAQKLIADEIGVALGAGTVSDMKLQLGFDVTDPSVSQQVFASNMGIVKEFIQNRLKGLQDLRYKSSTTDSSSTDQVINGVTYTLGPDGLYYAK